MPNERVTPIAFADVRFGYDVAETTRVTIGAEDILGSYPDRNAEACRFRVSRDSYEEDGGRWYVRVAGRV